jgi:hypothetical protein
MNEWSNIQLFYAVLNCLVQEDKLVHIEIICSWGILYKIL